MDPKILSHKSIQLVKTMFTTNDHASFHFWWNGDMVKHQQVLKYYDHDCQQIFFFFMSLLTASIVKNSHVLAEINFVFLKNAIDQT